MLRGKFLVITGVALLSLSLILLFSPEYIVNYSAVDVALHTTQYRLLVKTKYDFNNVSSIKKIPKNIDGWTGNDFRYPSRVYKILQAKIIFSRAYSKDGKLVWIEIINSDLRKSFHDPRVCYTSAGWKIVDYRIAALPINAGGLNKIYANVLFLKKDNNRLIAVYWFMFRGNEGVTMFKVCTFSGKNFNNSMETVKDFISDFVRVVYSNAKKPRTLIESLLSSGPKGYVAVILAVTLPLVIIGYGVLEIRNSNKSN